jgi:hypothetical protein
LRMYQPNVCTTSCRFVIRLSIATESSPSPGIDPRARSVSLIGAAVVVAELDQHDVAGPHVGDEPAPTALR